MIKIKMKILFKLQKIFNIIRYYTTWIKDSGTGLNLTNNINQLNNIQNSNDKTIIYPNGTTDKINCSGTYYESFKNNKFKLSNVHFAPNIKNNLISTHYI